MIFACFCFNFLRCIFSLKILFRPENFKGSQQKKFQVGSSFYEPLILQKGVTPHEMSRKFLSSGTISIVIDLSLKSTLMMSSAFFLNFSLKHFLKKIRKKAQNDSFGGVETIALNPAQIDFFGLL